MKSKAFSLVELSIVLVILGLLTGGILTGQSLIRAAELRAVTTEFQNYQTAVMTFRDKYFALPGDMSDAEAFWDTMATGTCPDATAGTGAQTCNGNGDGELTGASADSRAGERFTFWQHLANAGLIEGTYTGIAGAASGDDAVIGENTPASKVSQGGWAVSYWDSASGNGVWFDYDYDNHLTFGSQVPGFTASGDLLVPEEAWGIDKKIDDGKLGRGKVISRWVGCTDAANSAALDADYNLALSASECAFRMKAGF